MSRTRVGVIGTGWWATESHIPVLQALPDVEGLGRQTDRIACIAWFSDAQEIASNDLAVVL
jgi:predicted dehydrogenase